MRFWVTNATAWTILLKLGLALFAVILLLVTATWVQYPDGTRTINVAGVVLDVVAVAMIAGVVWSVRPRREKRA